MTHISSKEKSFGFYYLSEIYIPVTDDDLQELINGYWLQTRLKPGSFVYRKTKVPSGYLMSILSPEIEIKREDVIAVVNRIYSNNPRRITGKINKQVALRIKDTLPDLEGLTDEQVSSSYQSWLVDRCIKHSHSALIDQTHTTLIFAFLMHILKQANIDHIFLNNYHEYECAVRTLIYNLTLAGYESDVLEVIRFSVMNCVNTKEGGEI